MITLMSRTSLLKESRSEYREYIPSAILHSKQFIDESSSQSALPVIMAFRRRMSEEITYLVEAINQPTIRHAMVYSSGMLPTFEIAREKNPANAAGVAKMNEPRDLTRNFLMKTWLY